MKRASKDDVKKQEQNASKVVKEKEVAKKASQGTLKITTEYVHFVQY
jgi:hypothetical protein